MSNRLDKEKEQELQPKRMEYAIEQLEKRGFIIEYKDKTTLKFTYKSFIVTLYPYTGWHTGKSINDGRGIENLLKQLDK